MMMMMLAWLKVEDEKMKVKVDGKDLWMDGWMNGWIDLCGVGVVCCHGYWDLGIGGWSLGEYLGEYLGDHIRPSIHQSISN